MKEIKTRWLDLWGREISEGQAKENMKSTNYGKAALLEEDGKVMLTTEREHPNCLNRLYFTNRGPNVYERCRTAITILAYKHLVDSCDFDSQSGMAAYLYYVKKLDVTDEKMTYIKLRDELAKDFLRNKEEYVQEYLDSDEYKTKKREHKMIRDKMTNAVLSWS